MKVLTRYTFDASPRAVWPLLCNSEMALRPPLLFLLRIPRPKLCRLPSGVGGVGEPRECVSDKGSIKQRILAWEEPRRLRFEMVDTDIPFRRHVRSIVDSFDLETSPAAGTRVTRTTEIVFVGRFQVVKAVAVYLGLKVVHRYVFKNWDLLVRKAGATSKIEESPSR